MSTPNDFWSEFEVIDRYTRRQAIEDGVLVQLSGPGYEGDPWVPEMVAELGYRIPVAITATAFARYVELTPAAKRASNDIKGRLWDVLWMLHYAIATGPRVGSTIRFQLYALIGGVSRLVTLKAVMGPGDEAEPVLTIMWPDED